MFMAKEILIISLPNCSKCDEIKAYLKENKIPFSDQMLNSELQTELVMENVYSNPPNVKVDGKFYTYKDFKANPEQMFGDKTCSEGCSCCQK